MSGYYMYVFAYYTQYSFLLRILVPPVYASLAMLFPQLKLDCRVYSLIFFILILSHNLSKTKSIIGKQSRSIIIMY